MEALLGSFRLSITLQTEIQFSQYKLSIFQIGCRVNLAFSIITKAFMQRRNFCRKRMKKKLERTAKKVVACCFVYITPIHSISIWSMSLLSKCWAFRPPISGDGPSFCKASRACGFVCGWLRLLSRPNHLWVEPCCPPWKRKHTSRKLYLKKMRKLGSKQICQNCKQDWLTLTNFESLITFELPRNEPLAGSTWSSTWETWSL